MIINVIIIIVVTTITTIINTKYYRARKNAYAARHYRRAVTRARI